MEIEHDHYKYGMLSLWFPGCLKMMNQPLWKLEGIKWSISVNIMFKLGVDVAFLHAKWDNWLPRKHDVFVSLGAGPL